jgi:hypothetical protein
MKGERTSHDGCDELRHGMFGRYDSSRIRVFVNIQFGFHAGHSRTAPKPALDGL